MVRSNSDQKKLSKIQSIFQREQFERVRMDAIIERWTRLLALLEAFKAGQPVAALAQRCLEETSPQDMIDFANSFTEYNNIRAKIQTHVFLELWTVYVVFFGAFEAAARGGKASAGP